MMRKEQEELMRFDPHFAFDFANSTVVYRARRPFHPARLWEMIKNVFVVIQVGRAITSQYFCFPARAI